MSFWYLVQAEHLPQLSSACLSKQEIYCAQAKAKAKLPLPSGPRNIELISESDGRIKNKVPDFLSPGFQVSETELTLLSDATVDPIKFNQSTISIATKKALDIACANILDRMIKKGIFTK